jgi:hypothetical protein
LLLLLTINPPIVDHLEEEVTYHTSYGDAACCQGVGYPVDLLLFEGELVIALLATMGMANLHVDVFRFVVAVRALLMEVHGLARRWPVYLTINQNRAGGKEKRQGDSRNVTV